MTSCRLVITIGWIVSAARLIASAILRRLLNCIMRPVREQRVCTPMLTAGIPLVAMVTLLVFVPSSICCTIGSYLQARAIPGNEIEGTKLTHIVSIVICDDSRLLRLFIQLFASSQIEMLPTPREIASPCSLGSLHIDVVIQRPWLYSPVAGCTFV